MRPSAASMTNLALAASLLLCAPAWGQSMPGYRLIQVNGELGLGSGPELNNAGQIVFASRVGFDNSTREIWLYDGNVGELTRLTFNDYSDCCPVINDAGTIAWSARLADNGTSEVMVRTSDGVVTRLTHDDVDDSMQGINNLGQIVWSGWTRNGCGQAGTYLMFFDGQSIHQLTDDAYSNQGAMINDAGQIIWTEYDFCTDPEWTSLIKLYDNGAITSLSEPGLESQAPSINNAGALAWGSYEIDTGIEWITLVQDDEERMLTDWGRTPRLNDVGALAFCRWHSDEAAWNVWTWRSGQFARLTKTPGSHTRPRLNERGELAWLTAIESIPTHIYYLQRLPAGDLNCDGAVDGADIDAFFLALGRPAQYQDQFPECDRMLGDIDSDGAFDGADIDAFFSLLGTP